MKTRFVADALGVDYDWVEIDVVAGEAQSEDILSLNPVGQVPFARWPNGRVLPQSNAIMQYLAEISGGGERFIPSDPFQRLR